MLILSIPVLESLSVSCFSTTPPGPVFEENVLLYCTVPPFEELEKD
jgi:hypothetical protein